ALALDAGPGLVHPVSRAPASLGLSAKKDGALLAGREPWGDADDLFIDAKRSRLYISCGDGFLDVLEAEGNAYKRIAYIPTVPGARTSLFVPELDRLLLAVRAEAAEPAGIWVFRPIP